MKRMGIDPEMRLGEAMELYPQSFQMFRQIISVARRIFICKYKTPGNTISVHESRR